MTNEIITRSGLQACLGEHPWADRLTVLETVDSTNRLARELAVRGAPHGTAVLADHQTAGRGRRGRSFESPRGQGIYLSVILRFPVTPDRLLHLTAVVAEAVRRAILEQLDLETGVKWTNDLVWEKKKLCGILTELTLQPQSSLTDFVVAGIGVNCGQLPEDFAPEVAAMATSLRQILGRTVDRAALAAAILRQLHLAAEDLLTDPTPWMAGYRAHCITIGQDVRIVRGDHSYLAHADGMDDRGALLVTREDGAKELVNSGEVSVRGMYGYV